METIQVNGAPHFIAYYPIPTIRYILLIAVPSQELLTTSTAAQEQIAQSTRSTLIFSVFLVGGILILSLLASFAISSALMLPLRALMRTAEEITAGNLAATAEVKGQDEIGMLANTLNKMTSAFRELVGNLEYGLENTPSISKKKPYTSVLRLKSRVISPPLQTWMNF